MKKAISFIVGLLALTACTNNGVLTNVSQSQPMTTVEEPTSEPVPTIPSVPFSNNQVNKPEKPFNTKVEATTSNGYINGLKEFSMDFFNLLDNSDNQVFSPLSIATCYSMLYEGCDGKTREELASMLHYDGSFDHIEEIKNMLLRCAINDEEDGTYLDLSQSVWTKNDQCFKQEYIDYLTNNYYAEAFDNVHFAGEGKQQFADYINDKTNNFLNVKASDFASFNALTVVVLLNTIYLKSSWAISDLFAERYNTHSNFNNRDGSKSTVTLMNGRIEDARVYGTDTYTISSLPYNHGMSLNILDPVEGYYNAVLKDKTALSNLLNFQNMEYGIFTSDVVWRLPTFKMQRDYSLIPSLRQLGLEETFSRSPNFNRMIKPPHQRGDFYIHESKHAAGIEVNNKGVQAAAYTYIQIDEKSAASEIVRMNLDHPFAYSITTSEGYPLFMGVVNQL